MTGAYAQDWPGRGSWAQEWGRERGPKDRGRHGGHGGGCGRGRPGDVGSQAEALLGWALSRAKQGGGHQRPTPEELEELIAWRRMRGGPFGFGGPGGPFGRGPRGRGRGRARRGDVRLAVLRLLEQEPRNGYQLMQAIEERSGGRWRPSPGSMYPTLSQLEDEGLIRSAETQGARQFQLTDAGHEHLQTRAGEPDPWEPVGDSDETALTELAPLVIQIGKAAWQVASVGDESQRDAATKLLAETQRALYGILAEEPPAADDADSSDDDDDSGDSERPAG
jgi:DNA-binding PadR family transcriptional regulator